MRAFKSPGGFAAFLRAKAASGTIGARAGLEAAGDVLVAEMKREIGHYQEGDVGFHNWRKLAGSTLSEKKAHGQAPPDNPLKASGELRDSISRTVDGFKVASGTPLKLGRWQELGTKRPFPGPDGYHVPARSFIARAGFRKGKEAVERLAVEIIDWMTR